MASKVLVRPAGTSWMAVLGGWIATIGAVVLVAPVVAGLVARANGAGGITPAIPVVIGIFLSYLTGGYVAGRMAGYRTGWHGMLTAFFGLLILLLVVLLGYAADSGLLAGAGVKSLAELEPALGDLKVEGLGAALTFGALIGFLAAIFAGWVGGVIAPAHAAVPVAAAAQAISSPGTAAISPISGTRRGRAARRAARERRALGSFARKGGERVAAERQETKQGRRDTDIEPR